MSTKNMMSNKYNKAMALTALLAFPAKRIENSAIPLADLLLTQKLLEDYLLSPSHRTQPTKEQINTHSDVSTAT